MAETSDKSVSGDAMELVERLQDDGACASTPSEELERQIMDSRVPKNEREWWAKREIERLRSQGGAPEPTDDMAEAGRDWAQREWKASGDPKGYLDFYRGVYSAMLAAAPQPPVSQSVQPPEGGTGWRTIESAPKDGSDILAWSPGLMIGAMVLYWADGYWREKANCMGLKADITHWMPIPSPPGQGDRANASYENAMTEMAAISQKLGDYS